MFTNYTGPAYSGSEVVIFSLIGIILGIILLSLIVWASFYFHSRTSQRSAGEQKPATGARTQRTVPGDRASHGTGNHVPVG